MQSRRLEKAEAFSAETGAIVNCDEQDSGMAVAPVGFAAGDFRPSPMGNRRDYKTARKKGKESRFAT